MGASEQPGSGDMPFEDLLNEATSSLRDDAELRLDVRAELASHLEDKRDDFAAKGHSDNEALDLARQSFGPPEDVARDLLAANRRRMKLRALARLALRAVVVPAGILACVLVIAAAVGRFDVIDSALWLGGGHMPRAGLVPPAFEGLSDESRLILLGNPTRDTEAARQRAIWEAHPDDMAFFGNYVTTLAGEVRPGSGEDLFERELRQGMEIDPGNARYGFLHASHLLSAAAEEDWSKDTGDKLIVKDRALLDRAMAEYVKACRMPRLRTYTRNMLSLRLGLLPPEKRIEDRLLRAEMAAGVLYPDLYRHRQFARIVPHYSRLLIAEGRKDEARKILDSWFAHASLFAKDSWSLIDLLVLNAVLSVVEEKYSDVYRDLGDAEAAEETRRLAGRIRAPVNAYREGVQSESDDPARDAMMKESQRLLRRSGGVYVSVVMPALGDEMLRISPDALAPGAQLEHTLLEQAGLVLILALVLLAMFGALLVTLRWRLFMGADRRPLLVLPSWQDAARIFGLGVVAPLAGFLVYTRWTGLAGREFSLTYLLPRFAIEIVLLVGTIIFLTLSLGSAFVRRRWLVLGEEAPPPARGRRIGITTALAVLWVAWLFVRGEKGAVIVGSVETTVLGLVLLVIVVVGVMRLFFGRDKRRGRFYGSAARSLLPILGGAAVLIAALAYPYLGTRERDLLRQDRLMSIDPDDPALCRIERDLARRMTVETLRAVAEVEAERAQSE